MGKIVSNLIELIGDTPLVALDKYAKQNGCLARIIAKIESFNPGGSAKDRIAVSMIEDAEIKGLLKPGGTIIEPTSGNTGIGIAMVAAIKGYKAILTMPETMSIERRKLLKAYGAEIVLTPGNEGMNGAIAKAKELNEEIDNSIILQQFNNVANPSIHFATTGPEIWRETDGKVDFFVAGIGTGGTLSGVGKYLKSQNANVKIVGVEPAESPFIGKGQKGPHKIQGIGAGFIPQNLDMSIIDSIFEVKGDDAIKTSRELAKTEGLLVGISSGAALYVAAEIAKQKENENKTIVVLFPDGGERYLSTELFD